MRIAYRQNTLLEFATGPAWARMRPARSVYDILLGLPPCKPFVTCVRMNIEPPTELPPIRSLLHRKPYKLASLIHYRHLLPGHGLGLPHCQIRAL